jgi:Fe-S cluster biosynthesis and repair protein YggX
MSRIINCVKLNKACEGLATPPYPGALGLKVFENVSAEAWQLWLAHQTMLINEYRLSMLDITSREFLKTEMENFLFHGLDQKPEGYVAPK